MLVAIRSTLFTGAFFVATAILSILGAPVFLLAPQRVAVGYTQLWGLVCRALLRGLAGIRVEIRGREHIPQGAALVAAKHQSAFETFALLPLLPYPAMVMKPELGRIPLFGFYSRVSGMILVDRRKGATALREMTAQAKREAAKGRPVVIFPEGTRRTPGAPPAYQPGVALLYKGLGLPCVPVALDSGLFWPRRSFRKYPGTIVVEFLPPIPPGLDSKTFLARLEAAIEGGSDRLLAEAAASANPPPLPEEAKARLAVLSAP